MKDRTLHQQIEFSYKSIINDKTFYCKSIAFCLVNESYHEDQPLCYGSVLVWIEAYRPASRQAPVSID